MQNDKFSRKAHTYLFSIGKELIIILRYFNPIKLFLGFQWTDNSVTRYFVLRVYLSVYSRQCTYSKVSVGASVNSDMDRYMVDGRLFITDKRINRIEKHTSSPWKY